MRINLHFVFYSYTEIWALLTVYYYLCMYEESTQTLVFLIIWLYPLFSSGALLGYTSINCRSWKDSDAQIYGNIMMEKNPQSPDYIHSKFKP